MADRQQVHYAHKSDHYFQPAGNSGELLFRIGHEIWLTDSDYAVERQSIITLLQVRKGAGSWQMNRAQGELEPGQLLCYGLNEPFCLQIREPLELRILCINRWGAERLLACGIQPGSACNLGAAARPCWRLMAQILHCAHGDNPQKERICNALLEAWFVWCASTPDDARAQVSDDPASRALLFIETRLDRIHSLEDVARHCECSPEHLGRLFQAKTGRSPWDYIRQRQMQLAAEILRTGEPIQDVAARFGYNDRYAFAKAFKKIIGCPPGSLRNHLPPPAPKQ